MLQVFTLPSSPLPAARNNNSEKNFHKGRKRLTNRYWNHEVSTASLIIIIIEHQKPVGFPLECPVRVEAADIEPICRELPQKSLLSIIQRPI